MVIAADILLLSLRYALFVASKLAPMDNVLSTATSFVLKKYKDDGMIFYRRIVKDYKDALKENGFLLFETGYDQKEEIVKLADENSLLCECLCDYGKNHRGVAMRRN